MKILIVDNEEHLRTGLKKMLQKYVNDDTQIEEAEGVKSGIIKIDTFNPDIVFLDIEMGDGTGFDLLTQLSKPKFQLIFTTAHNQYAIQAFKFSAIDYLLKPIDIDELKLSLEKAIGNINKNDISKQLSVMLQQLGGHNNDEKKLVLNDKQSTYFIKLTDLIYCEAEGPYTKFYIKDMHPILISQNLKDYEDMLTPHNFIRTHHSYLINPSKIKMYDKADGGALILEGGHSVPISKRKKEAVMDIITRHL